MTFVMSSSNKSLDVIDNNDTLKTRKELISDNQDE